MTTSVSQSASRPSGPLPPIPLVVITGFLGAGKTTLLNRLLKDPALADTVVIVNEFGEIGLDHLLMESADEGMLLLSSGCLCCSIRGDLVATLEDLLRRRDNGRIAPFKRVVIETTGLADPAPILHTLIYHPYLGLRFALDGVVTLVDAVNGAATLDAHPEAVKQAAVADRLVLTKTDMSTGDTDTLRARLRALNPVAPILDAARGEAVAARLLDAGLYDIDGKIADVRGWLSAEAFDDSHARHGHGHHGHEHHDHHHGHDHDHDHDHAHAHAHAHHHDVNRHDARIRAFCLSTPEAIGRGRFEAFLDLLRSAHGPNLLRVKGLVKLADDPARPVVVQGVQHLFHPPVTLPAWPDADHATRLVFILRDLDESFVRRLWSAFTGEPIIDGPDAAALMDNPLALRR